MNHPDPWPYQVLTKYDGYALELDGDKLLVTPAPDAEAREYIILHRETIVATCRRVDSLAAVFAELNRPLDERRARRHVPNYQKS